METNIKCKNIYTVLKVKYNLGHIHKSNINRKYVET